MRSLVWLSVVAALSACPPTPKCDAGSCDTPDAGPSDAGADAGHDAGALTPEQFCNQQYAAYFDGYVRCGLYDPSSAAEAVANQAASCASYANHPALAAGRQRFDGDAARRCIDELNALSCGAVFSTPSCGALHVGLVGAGGSCFDTSDCVAELACDTHLTCPGRCVPRIDAGQPVADWETCVEGTTSFEGVCTPPLALGASCAPNDAGHTPWCGTQAYCSPGTARCVAPMPRAGVGGACDDTMDRYCELGLRCVSGVCTARVPIDGGCAVTFECQLPLSCLGNRCQGRAAEGERCTAYRCATGLFCALDADGGTEGVCHRRSGVGGACTSRDACLEGTWCDASNQDAGTCRTKRTAGEACDLEHKFVACRDELYCDAVDLQTPGSCRARLTGGEACLDHDACLSGRCQSDGGCDREYCVDRRP